MDVKMEINSSLYQINVKSPPVIFIRMYKSSQERIFCVADGVGKQHKWLRCSLSFLYFFWHIFFWIGTIFIFISRIYLPVSSLHVLTWNLVILMKQLPFQFSFLNSSTYFLVWCSAWSFFQSHYLSVRPLINGYIFITNANVAQCHEDWRDGSVWASRCLLPKDSTEMTLWVNWSTCAIMHSNTTKKFKNRELDVYPFKLTRRILKKIQPWFHEVEKCQARDQCHGMDFLSPEMTH